MPTSAQTHFSYAFDPTEWQATPTTSTTSTIWRNRWLQQVETTRWSTAKMGSPYVGSPLVCNRWHADTSWTFDVRLIHLRKENREQHQSRAQQQAQDRRLRPRRFVRKKQLLRRNKLLRFHLGEVGKTMERGVEPSHTVAAIGIAQDKTMGKETGDNITRPLHRSWHYWRRAAISAHDWTHHRCEWSLRGIWAG